MNVCFVVLKDLRTLKCQERAFRDFRVHFLSTTFLEIAIPHSCDMCCLLKSQRTILKMQYKISHVPIFKAFVNSFISLWDSRDSRAREPLARFFFIFLERDEPKHSTLMTLQCRGRCTKYDWLLLAQNWVANQSLTRISDWRTEWLTDVFSWPFRLRFQYFTFRHGSQRHK